MIESNYIIEVKGKDIIPGGVFSSDINFHAGLNLIAGSNGVGKTLLLKYIQNHRNNSEIIFEKNNEKQFTNIAVFSPKRNAQRTLAEQAYRIVRQYSNDRNSSVREFLNQQIKDDDIQLIKSISEYLILEYQDLIDTKNKNSTQASDEVEEQYSSILQKLFPYTMNFRWDTDKRNHHFIILKENVALQVNQLSSGENALISLMFALYYGRNSAHIYLIDEPEVHLNWQLEEKLFEFLDWFADKFKKQIIVSTHSRACFIQPFLDKTQFLIWNNDSKIQIIEKPNSQIIELLAGDTVKIINGFTAEKKLVFCEDKTHNYILTSIKNRLNLSWDIPNFLGSCSEVIKTSKLMKSFNVNNIYFLVDGDNRKIKDSDQCLNLIQLDKYCIENYFIDEEVLNRIDIRPDKSKPIRTLINESIKQVKDPNFAVIKELIKTDANYDLQILDVVDASKFINTLLKLLGYNDKEQFFDSYIDELHKAGELQERFKILMETLEN